MDDLELIDSYFKSSPTDEQKRQFDKRMIEDTAFANEVAFYISANEAIAQELKEEKKQRFRELYNQRKVVRMKQPIKKLWKYMAAAGVLAIVLIGAWLFIGNNYSTKQLADNYIKQNFNNVSVTMNTRDSLQMGLNLLNTDKLPEALQLFENLVKSDPANSTAQKYAGIVSLRMDHYDKALEYFTGLEADTSLYSNPGTFYKAITLLSRNMKGDKAKAKELLRKVIDEGLEGEKEAIDWLKKL